MCVCVCVRARAGGRAGVFDFLKQCCSFRPKTTFGNRPWSPGVKSGKW